MAKKDTVFVMLLFALFCFTAFVLVMIGVKQYKLTADSMDYNYEVRTATSYLREKTAQNDSGSGIEVQDIDGTQAICLTNTINDKDYYTYIYYYDGYLRELFVADDSVYSMESGQQIIELSGMDITENSLGFVEVKLIDTSGSSSTVFLETKSKD